MSFDPKCVLVLRPHAAGLRTAGRLQALGHKTVTAPILTIMPTDEPVPVGPFDAVCLTSAAALVRAAQLSDDLKQLPLLAVGERTALLSQAEGFANIHAADGERHSLATLAQRYFAGRPNCRVLLALGFDHKDDTVDLLRAAGVEPVTWIAYAAMAVEQLPDGARSALTDGRVDIVMHYSRRSATIACVLVEQAGLWSEFSHLTHIVLSEDVAVPLIERGVQRVFPAKIPHEDEMLALLAKMGSI